MAVIICDCDGVLVSTIAVQKAFYDAYLRPYGVAYSDEDIASKFGGVGIAGKLDTFAADYKVKTGKGLSDSFFENGKLAYEDACVNYAHVISGIPDLLRKLSSEGHTLAVATNSRLNSLKGKLERAGIAQYFGERVFAAEQVARPKPAPDLIHYVVERSAKGAEKTLFAGDTLHDVEAAKLAGCDKIIITRMDYPPGVRDLDSFSNAGADAVVESPAAFSGVVIAVAAEVEELSLP